MRMKTALIISLTLLVSTAIFAQNTNSSTTQQPETKKTNRSATKPERTTVKTNAAASPSPGPAQTKSTVTPQPPGSTAVVAAFNALLDGIRRANVNRVTGVYWNSPRLILFNNNGTVTKSWEQVRKNRESSYPDLKDVKLEVRDVSITMLGPDGAVVSCLWTQSQTYKGTPETASGRMTLVFKRFGKDWKAVHLHTSPDKEDPSRVLPSEQTSPSPSPTPSPTPAD